MGREDIVDWTLISNKEFWSSSAKRLLENIEELLIGGKWFGWRAMFLEWLSNVKCWQRKRLSSGDVSGMMIVLFIIELWRPVIACFLIVIMQRIYGEWF